MARIGHQLFDIVNQGLGPSGRAEPGRGSRMSYRRRCLLIAAECGG